MSVCRNIDLLLLVATVLLISAIPTQSRDSFPPPSKPGKCSAGGQCDTYDSPLSGPLPIPCSRPNSDPFVTKLDKDLLANFKSLCPDHARLAEKGQPLCCDEGQIVALVKNTNTPSGLLGGCPSCIRNFAAFYCTLACDPNQASFYNVTKTGKNDSIVDITVRVPPSFRDTYFDSCENVVAPGIGKAILFFCGTTECDPFKFLNFLNTKPRSPYDVTFDFPSDPSKSMPIGALNCSVAPTKEQWPRSQAICSCSDCLSSCPYPFPFDDGTTFQNKLIKIFSLTIIAVTLVFSAMFLIIFSVSQRRKLRISDSHTISKNLIDDRESKNIHSPSASKFEKLLHCWCRLVIRRPLVVTFLGVVFLTILSCGIFMIRMESDPVLLWSGPTSRGRIEKDFFDKSFGPFFRIQNTIFTIDETSEGAGHFPDEKDPSYNWSSVFRREFLLEVLRVQKDIQKLVATNSKKTKLQDICYAPVSEGKCMVQTPLIYFQSNETILMQDDYLERLKKCLDSPYQYECLAEWGGPGLRDVILGWPYDPNEEMRDQKQDDPDQPKEPSWKKYGSNATSIVMTFLLNNPQAGTSAKSDAEAWEAQFINYLLNVYKNRSITLSNNKTLNYRISFYSERSIEDEIGRQSHSDIATIALSYALMFAYIGVALGKIVSIRRLFLDARVTLGLAGVLVVLASVTSAIGILAFTRAFSFNLIIIEVIPFLILAVGVDNIFLLVQSFDRESEREEAKMKSCDANESPQVMSTEQKIEVSNNILSHVFAEESGPSILVSSISESICFLIGALVSNMPAVRVFALTACLSLFFLLLFQVTIFLALFSLDIRRRQKGLPDPILSPLFVLLYTLGLSGSPDEEEPIVMRDSERLASKPKFELSRLVTGKLVSPYITNDIVRLGVVMIWAATFAFCLQSIPRLDIGLDQEVAVPLDSYVLHFLRDQKSILRVGPPVYFVVDSANTSPEVLNATTRHALCSFGECDLNSLGNMISANSLEGLENAHRLNETKVQLFLAGSPASWVDTFISSWMRNPDCCQVEADDETKFCPSGSNATCVKCIKDGDAEVDIPLDKMKALLPHFLKMPPSPKCPSGGRAQFLTAVNQSSDGKIIASYLSSYHLPVRTSTEMINCLLSARQVAAKAEEYLTKEKGIKDIHVFPYSIFYVYYEQYLGTWKNTFIGLSSSLATVVVVVSISRALKTIWPHIALCISLISFLVHVMGLMHWVGIELNALSLVNLIMSVGISVEFCNHFLVSFVAIQSAHKSSTAKEVVKNVVEETGASILAGITLTKLIGIFVLAFASSRIFSLYYFRFYLLLVIVGGVHSLFYIPAMMTFSPDKHDSKDRSETEVGQANGESGNGHLNESFAGDGDHLNHVRQDDNLIQ